MSKNKQPFKRLALALSFDSHTAAHAIVGGRHRAIIKPHCTKKTLQIA